MLRMIIINKMRSLLLFFVTLFRRALCCFRRRRRLSYAEPLTDIDVIQNKQSEVDTESWNNWGNDAFIPRKPTTVQEHIEFYRQQKVHIQTQQATAEEQSDLFEDMTPQITAQKKLLIGSNVNNRSVDQTSSLSLVPDTIITGNQLEDWDESSGWESEQLESDALEVVKEKKRLERERKALEQQQRRIERSTKSLTINVKVNA